MKLRSGKIVSTFPTKLERKLESALQDFKILFADRPTQAKELLEIISNADTFDVRLDIIKKVDEMYGYNYGTAHWKSAAGELAILLLCNPQYHDIIQLRVQNFDLETPLLGNAEEI